LPPDASSPALAALRGAARALGRLPEPLSNRLGIGVGWFLGTVIRHRRRDALEALRLSFPDRSRAELEDMVRGMYRHLGLNLAELSRMIGRGVGAFQDRYVVVGEENLREALDRGKGAFGLTAHLGNWELSAALMPSRGYPTAIVVREIKNPAVNGFWVGIREASGLSVIHRRGAARACIWCSRDNVLVVFVLDQNMTRSEGVFVDFFGRPACTSPGLARLAARLEMPVVPCRCRRRADGVHELKFFPLLEPPPDAEPETIHAATQTYTRLLEEMIREMPEQWIWIHRRWRTRPLEV
jgi:KDO2-lipid IV(A) lauroyltransferase